MKGKLAKLFPRDILVEDLRVGDRIITKLQEDKALGVTVGVSSVQVKDLDVCPGQWRTHIHVNKTDCHDMRTTIKVVA